MYQVRFAPSPTGHLHVGSVRTALFNWLFARHYGGKFILRIEDTDQVRSTYDSFRAIIEGLNWLGLDWDEGPAKEGEVGPYLQSERRHIYHQYAQKLLDEKKAFYCQCTEKNCRCQQKNLSPEGSAIRFIVPEGETVVHDIIRGDVVFKNDQLKDFIIVKSDTFPVYNFAVVVDDYLMKITHVIRGEEHLSNTPRQILLYQALGFELPNFAHLPIILHTDRSKLSKRHGAVYLENYQEEGFLPEAMLNYLALLGWSAGDDTEIFTLDQLIEKFTLDGVTKAGGIFDKKKLEWMNGCYLRNLSPDKLLSLVKDQLISNKFVDEATWQTKKEWIAKILVLIAERVRTISQLIEMARPYFTDEIVFDPKAVKKYLTKDYVSSAFQKFTEKLRTITNFNEEETEKALREVADSLALSGGDLIHPVRVALTGKSVSPGLFEVMVILGQEKCIQRLEQILKQIPTEATV